jgi:hypothetical protein
MVGLDTYYREGPDNLPKSSFRQGLGMPVDRGLLEMSKLVGIPAGVETYHAASRAGRPDALWFGMAAGARQTLQPVGWGLMETVGLMPSTYFEGATPGFSFLGLGVEKKMSIRDAIAKKQSPWKVHGHVLGKKGAQWMGMKGASRAIPVIGSVLGLMDTIHQVHKGYERGGMVGAAKGFAGAAATSVTANVALRAVGSVPALALAIAPIVAGVAVAGQVSQNLQANSRALPLNLAGDMSAFQTGKANTMRQRSLQAIQRSHLNARSVLGNEAQYQHISSSRGF